MKKLLLLLCIVASHSCTAQSKHKPELLFDSTKLSVEVAFDSKGAFVIYDKDSMVAYKHMNGQWEVLNDSATIEVLIRVVLAKDSALTYWQMRYSNLLNEIKKISDNMNKKFPR